MSPLRVDPIAGAPLAAVKAPAAAAKAAGPALQRACEEFETAFIKEMLRAAKIGGNEADHGYGAMAVDALAGGIQAGGGLGLARALERALEHQREVSAADKPAAPKGA